MGALRKRLCAKAWRSEFSRQAALDTSCAKTSMASGEIPEISLARVDGLPSWRQHDCNRVPDRLGETGLDARAEQAGCDIQGPAVIPALPSVFHECGLQRIGQQHPRSVNAGAAARICR